MQKEISNVIVKKPWGEEYSILENKKLAIWLLKINPNEKTSLHCHPKKKTGLILLDGEAQISLIEKSFPLRGLGKIMIRNWMFHQTKNVSQSEPIYVIEVETPNDKYDLIRIDDAYGRKNQPFENASFWLPKNEKCLDLSSDIKHTFNDSVFEFKTIRSVLNSNAKDNEVIVVLDEPAFKTKDGKELCDAGEVLTVKILRMFDTLFVSQMESPVLHICTQKF